MAVVDPPWPGLGSASNVVQQRILEYLAAWFLLLLLGIVVALLLANRSRQMLLLVLVLAITATISSLVVGSVVQSIYQTARIYMPTYLPLAWTLVQLLALGLCSYSQIAYCLL